MWKSKKENIGKMFGFGEEKPDVEPIEEIIPTPEDEPVKEIEPEETPEQPIVAEPEEKVVVETIPSGWSVMTDAPKDGTNIRVTFDGGNSVVAYWRRTRVRDLGQWKPSGRWTNPLTHQQIDFIPKYWQEFDYVVESNISVMAADKARIADLEKQISDMQRVR